MLAAVVVRASRVPLLRRAGSPGRHLPSSLARRVGSLALALPRMTVAPPKGLGSSNFTCASASLRWGVPRRCVCSGSAVDSASKPSRAERRRRDREQTKIRRGRADESPTLSAADTASRTLWESEPVLFESSRAGLVRLLSALSITQAGGWTWFAATSYGPMAVPQYAAEGAFQMSYGLTAALLTVSYGFLAGVWFYARHYVCRLRICNPHVIEVATHTLSGGLKSRELEITALECSDTKLVLDYQRFKRAGSFGFYLIDRDRGLTRNRKGLSAFMRAIKR